MINESNISEKDLEEIRDLIPGPEPSAPKSIPVADTALNGNELRYLTQCILSNWISSAGPFVREFENRFAREMGCEYGVACSSGTIALHLAVTTLGIGPGDEVIIPAFTMVATASAVSYTGAVPVLVDAEPDTWNMDVSQIEAKITPRTKAIIVVHVYGHPVDMDPVLEIARRRGLYVIEDAAEAHGAAYHGRPVGSLGDVACFSFYANKIVTTGEGGMVTTNDEAIGRVARRLRDHAFSDERHFWHKYCGFSYRMTNLQAAVGLAQTERLAELVERRRSNARLYTELLKDIPGLTLPKERPGVKNVFWMYGVVVEDAFGCSRDELREHLAGSGIESRTFFIPIHLQPVHFEKYRGLHFPVAEHLCRKGMYLPSGATLTAAQIRFVAGAIRKAPRTSAAAAAKANGSGA